MNVRRIAAIVCGLVALADAAPAQPLGWFPDQEPANNNISSPPVFTLFGVSGARAGAGTLGGQFDVDFIQVFLLSQDVVTIVTTPVGGPPGDIFSTPDTVASIRNDASIGPMNNDAGSDSTLMPARGSVVRLRVASNGVHRVGIEGVGGATGPYHILTSTYPGAAAISADWIFSEPNDDVASAPLLGLPWSGPIWGLDSIASGADVDYFAVDLRAGDVLVATTTPIHSGTNFFTPDTVLTVFASDGVTPLVENDDDFATESPAPFPNRGSTIRLYAESSGRHYLRVRGFNASSVGNYLLTVGVLPRELGIRPADLNGDGLVNSVDLVLLLGSWGP